jgi:hypothetical protein
MTPDNRGPSECQLTEESTKEQEDKAKIVEETKGASIFKLTVKLIRDA